MDAGLYVGVPLPLYFCRMGNTRDAEVSPGRGTVNAVCLSLAAPMECEMETTA